MPLSRQLRQVVDGLGGVVVPPPTDPRMLLAQLEDEHAEGVLDVTPEVLRECG